MHDARVEYPAAERTRPMLILRSISRATLWLYAHAALEWLFHATKPSVVSAATVPVRLLLLCAAPLPLLAILLPAQALLAGADTMRREAKAYWLAALLPASIAAVLYVVAVDNFARTLTGFGISDASGTGNAVCLALVLLLAVWLLRGEALALARPRAVVYSAVPAAVVVAASVAAYAVAVRHGQERLAEPSGVTVAAARRPNILLVGIDGATAAHSSAYGYQRKTTPTLEALAARGVLYENAFSNAGPTYGSLITLLSGKLPTETNILFPPAFLSGKESVEHLPGILRAAGYATAQVGMRYYADAYDWNMAGAFEQINGRTDPEETLQPYRSEARERLVRYQRELAERVVGRVLHLTFVRPMEDEFRFLTGHGERSPFFEDERRLRLAKQFLQSRREPWFLHVHLLDTHCCDGSYDRKLQEVDGHIGRLLALLRSIGQLERTLIVVYSDHSRGWKTLERLPLVLVPPGGTAPRRVKANVQLADVAPTILAHLGIPQARWMSGRPLQQELDPRRPIYSLVEIGSKDVLGPGMSGVRNADPPFYGVTSAGVVVCDRWGKLGFETRRFKSGRIAGHTAPCAEPVTDGELQALLVAHLRANGYPVGAPASPQH
ncbi:MAG TPA: sulfatase-like hydrolase/transferase [Thermoanaerobaculia bacterium]|jgi:hypothetical protein